MAGMGFKCYRLSVSWTRILPNGDDDTPQRRRRRLLPQFV